MKYIIASGYLLCCCCWRREKVTTPVNCKWHLHITHTQREREKRTLTIVCVCLMWHVVRCTNCNLKRTQDEVYIFYYFGFRAKITLLESHFVSRVACNLLFTQFCVQCSLYLILPMAGQNTHFLCQHLSSSSTSSSPSSSASVHHLFLLPFQMSFAA